ncbi:MAG: glucokinase [Rhizobiaceae bacterium]|nr:glucokinase [Rhizobiaceae bacterium]
MFDFPILVADIGGTNARFALVQDAHSMPILNTTTQVADHQDIGAAIDDAVLSKTSHQPKTIILAIAGPLDGDAPRLTNADWSFSPDALIERFELETVVIMNDFAAQALATIAIDGEHLITIAEGENLDDGPKVVVGPGTGLGVASIVQANGKWIILPSEGGHMDLGPRSEREFQIWPNLKKKNGRMEAELAISGQGIENLYQAIKVTDEDTAPSKPTLAADITQAAIENSDPAAVEAVELFFTMLGRFCGDLALLTLARGGVYIAGGIGVQLAEQFSSGPFLAAYRDKMPMQAIVESIGVQLIVHPNAALEGMIAFARAPEMCVLDAAIIVHANENANG